MRRFDTFRIIPESFFPRIAQVAANLTPLPKSYGGAHRPTQDLGQGTSRVAAIRVEMAARRSASTIFHRFLGVRGFCRFNNSLSKGFTLLEVTVALAVFALIAIPTIGLMTMSARQAENRIGVSNASELKKKVELEVAASGSAFTWDLTTPVVLYANEDLTVIGYSPPIPPDPVIDDSDKFYRIEVQEPVGYVFNAADAYRLFIYNVIWPAFVETSPGVFTSNEANEGNLEQMILTSVISK